MLNYCLLLVKLKSFFFLKYKMEKVSRYNLLPFFDSQQRQLLALSVFCFPPEMFWGAYPHSCNISQCTKVKPMLLTWLCTFHVHNYVLDHFPKQPRCPCMSLILPPDNPFLGSQGGPTGMAMWVVHSQCLLQLVCVHLYMLGNILNLTFLCVFGLFSCFKKMS